MIKKDASAGIIKHWTVKLRYSIVFPLRKFSYLQGMSDVSNAGEESRERVDYK